MRVQDMLKPFLILLTLGIGSHMIAQTPPPAAANLSTTQSSQKSGQTQLQFLAAYNWFNTTGFEGGAAQYTDLHNSFGGTLGFTYFSAPRDLKWALSANFITKNDYRYKTRLSWGNLLTVTASANSLISHPTALPFGTDLTFDLNISQDLPNNQLFTKQRTWGRVRADLHIPHTPLTVFVRAENQAQRGFIPSRYFDMSSTTTCGVACHETERGRSINYTTQTRGAGITLKTAKVMVTYEHDDTDAGSHFPAPYDYFGRVAPSPPDDLLPPGVSATPAGYYQHDLMPAHQDHVDMLSAHIAFSPETTLDANITRGRLNDVTAGNSATFTNAHALFHTDITNKLWGEVEYRQDNTLNDFQQPVYPAYPNADFRRFTGTLRAGYRLTPRWTVEGYYERRRTSRSNSDLFPQIYSPDNADVLTLVGLTKTNVLGAKAEYHHSIWNLKGGYEWLSTTAPGYLTKPGLANRLYFDLNVMPSSHYFLANQASILWQRHFNGIQRRNNLFWDNLSFAILPTSTFHVTLAYGYQKEDLRTDLIYGTDPFYEEGLVPYSAVVQSYSATATYDIERRMNLKVRAGHVSASGGWTPSLPSQASMPYYPSVYFGSAYYNVDIPQDYADASLNYTFMKHLRTGFTLGYNSYSNKILPMYSGILRTAAVYIGGTW
jgi:hypothetical protein